MADIFSNGGLMETNLSAFRGEVTIINFVVDRVPETEVEEGADVTRGAC